MAALQNFLLDDEQDEEVYPTDAANRNQPGAPPPSVNLDVEYRNVEVEVDDLLRRDVLFLLGDEETSDEEDPGLHDRDNESNDGTQTADPSEIHVSCNETQLEDTSFCG